MKVIETVSEYSNEFYNTIKDTVKNIDYKELFFQILNILKNAAKQNPVLCITAGFILLRFISKKLKKRMLPNNVILELDLSGIVQWKEQNGGLGMNKKDTNSVKSIIYALKEAKTNKKVKALVATFSDINCNSVTHIQELREAIKDFRSSGKPAYCITENCSMKDFYLAGAFDHRYVIPTGTVMIHGFGTNIPFVKSFLDKVGLEFLCYHKKEFKTAGHIFTKESMTDEHREQVRNLQEGISEIILNDLSEDLNIDVDKLYEIFGNGPYNTDEAKELGLITDSIYKREMYKRLEEDIGLTASPLSDLQLKHSNFITKFLFEYKDHSFITSIKRYYNSPSYMYCDRFFSFIKLKHFNRGKNQIAVVNVEGAITDSKAACNALKQAARNKKVKGIVLRVDSPGGTINASDIIMNEVEKVKEAGIKVVAYFDHVSASGGYYISQKADKIVSNPLTITGSIGVIMGKFYITPAINKLGITTDPLYLENHELAKNLSPLYRFDEKGEEIIEKNLSKLYNRFVSEAASGRNVEDVEQFEELCRGRVYSGAQALEINLVDKIGGYFDAISLCAQECGLNDNNIRVVVYPKNLSLVQKFKRMFKIHNNSFEKENEEGEASVSQINLIKSTISSLVQSSINTFPGLSSLVRFLPLPNFFKEMMFLGTISHSSPNSCYSNFILTLTSKSPLVLCPYYTFNNLYPF